jgi:hypothetical protein
MCEGGGQANATILELMQPSELRHGGDRRVTCSIIECECELRHGLTA